MCENRYHFKYVFWLVLDPSPSSSKLLCVVCECNGRVKKGTTAVKRRWDISQSTLTFWEKGFRQCVFMRLWWYLFSHIPDPGNHMFLRPRAKSNHIFIIYNTYICIAHRIGDCIAHRSGGSGGAQLDVLIFIPSTVDCVCFCLRLLCQGDQGACGRPPTAPRILNQALLTQHCNICESLTCDAETGTHLSPPFIKS